jgi:hypothetical protein
MTLITNIAYVATVISEDQVVELLARRYLLSQKALAESILAHGQASAKETKEWTRMLKMPAVLAEGTIDYANEADFQDDTLFDKIQRQIKSLAKEYTIAK